MTAAVVERLNRQIYDEGGFAAENSDPGKLNQWEGLIVGYRPSLVLAA